MMYASVAVFIILVLVNLLFRIASFFRLGLPLLYALAAPILFPAWVQEQETLATTHLFCVDRFSRIQLGDHNPQTNAAQKA